MCPKSYLYIYDFSAYLHLCPSDRFGTDRGWFYNEPVLCIFHPVRSGGTCFPTRCTRQWNHKYEERSRPINKKSTIIYYCNAMGITKHGLRPVALQSSVVTIVLESNLAYTSPPFWGTWSSFKYLFPYTEPSRRQAVILGLGVHWRSYLLVFPYRRLLIP